MHAEHAEHAIGRFWYSGLACECRVMAGRSSAFARGQLEIFIQPLN